MTNLRTLRDWVPEIGDLTAATRKRATGHVDSSDFYRALIKASTWQGDAANEATVSMLMAVFAHDVRAEDLSKAADAMGRAERDAQTLANTVKAILDDAGQNPAVDVNQDTNQVSAPSNYDYLDDDTKATVSEKIADLGARIADALAEGDRINTELAQAMAQASGIAEPATTAPTSLADLLLGPLKPGETRNMGPIAGTGSDPGIPGIGAADLGEIVTLPDGRQVAIFGDSFSGPGVQGTHYPSVAVEVKTDPRTGQMTFTKVLTGSDGSNTIFPIPESVKKEHPEATFTLPAGTIQANGKTYMKVAATDGHLQPTGGSWLVEITNTPENGWTAIGDNHDGKPPTSYQEWKYDHTPTPKEPWKVTGQSDNPPSQISGYQDGDGKVHIAANSFDRSQPVTMYQVDNPADVADPTKWRPLLADGAYGAEGQLSTTPISDSKFGELTFREVDGRPVLSGLNLGPGGGVEVYVGSAGHPEGVLDNRPVQVGGFDGPAKVEAPYGGYIVPNADGSMPHLEKMPILVSQWTPGADGVPGTADDKYNTQQVFVNATPSR
ncbi:DUF4185 domain-containing protein [Mycolicibacterium peregrinum]|uniref:DUF4185 domain-containing protein n=1 Tax=Mycolicibacterium peregrinum TaxID=43304 RepID=A0A4Z0HGI8_MYCPR|nr:DUF4185 domain-containing protein [Mycolicibacterium peregrinum]TGB35816.1 DUF4185 domain-containing protein [Mycolicibacterium peregrinum]TGB36028.1 DUF4185 domain-containing protein [Mycolicibacterium peregrinum]